MTNRLPTVRAAALIAALERAGFEQVRQKGSHVRLRHPDGRATTVPVHPGEDLDRGLLRLILSQAGLTRAGLARLLDHEHPA